MTDFVQQIMDALLRGSDVQCGACKSHAEKFAPRVAAAINAAGRAVWDGDTGRAVEEAALAALRGEP